MFESLSDRLTGVLQGLRGKGRLTDADIDATSREIRLALLEADVSLPVVREFVARIKERAKGAEVSGALNPAQQVVKIVNEELIGILGGETRQLAFAKTPPTVIMLAGLQGSGKTTLAGKLAKWLRGQGHTPLLVAADLQRPGAVNQLQIVGERAGVEVFAPHPGVSSEGSADAGPGDPVAVASAGLAEARARHFDVVIVDTAGRLGIDEELMSQAAAIRRAVDPDEVLFVLDAMIGQDAVTTAEAFREGVGFTGVVLTKLDGDARGGAALSVREVTGVPILFASAGEKLDDFDVFHPDRMASRILGMGDVLTLIEQAEQVFDAEQAEAAAAKIGTGELTLEDFLEQMLAIRKMGPIGNLLGMLPGAGQMKEALAAVDDRQLDRRAGHHPRHDAGRADRPQDHQRLPAAADRQRVRRDGVGGQPARRPVLRGPQDDVVDGGADGHALRAQGRQPQGWKGQGQEGQEGRTRADAAEGAQPAGRGTRHARRLPRPVADAQGPGRAAAGAGRYRPVEAEVSPGKAMNVARRADAGAAPRTRPRPTR